MKQLPNEPKTYISVHITLIRLTERHTSTVYDVYFRLSFEADENMFQIKNKIEKNCANSLQLTIIRMC